MWFVLVVCVGLAHGQQWSDPVSTTQGLIRGQLSDDGDYFMYLGIPYAKINETNPFGESLPHPKWDGVFDAVDDTAICPQEEEFGRTIVGTLDCLHLNVFVPNTTQSKIPVMVYIYGGGFNIGFYGRFLYGPKYLVRHDIILVVLNYRLGPYGFMCLDTEEIPGNQGLKDQYSALQWIHKNIASFGGDPNKITLVGQSAGSMSVDFHVMSEYPKLYQQIILQSGTGIVPELVVPSDKTIPLQLAKYLGFTTTDINEALSFLTDAHTDEVIAATLQLGIKFSVCVEKEFSNKKRMLKQHPEFNKIAKAKDIKVVAGFTENELGMTNIDDDDDSFVESTISKSYEIEDGDGMIDTIKRFYIGDEKVNGRVARELTNLASDCQFNHPIQRGITKYLEAGAQVYQYMYSYTGNRNFMHKLNNATFDGAVHADELGYMFDMIFIPEPITADDQLMIDRLTTLWANFVKYGNPTPSVSDLIPVKWEPATLDVIPYLDIGANLTTGQRPYHERMAFWDLFHYANTDKLKAKM